MKKIINGKVYDTDTAKECGAYSYSNPSDFNHISETLFRKKTGEFFIWGAGGPMTKYAMAIDQNSWSGGQRIMPMSFSEAREWAEEHLDPEEYEAIFGEVIEDDTKVLTAFNLTKTTAERIRREASESGISMSALVEEKFI